MMFTLQSIMDKKQGFSSDAYRSQYVAIFVPTMTTDDDQ